MDDGAAFEALCRAHLMAFVRGAEKYKAETNLSKRVGNWQGRLAPLLKEEEQRPIFDMKVYSERVLESMRQKGDEQWTEFGEVTQLCEPYEVCRLFLASLSLCNSGNVSLRGDPDKQDSIQIELLVPELHQPMETFMAPSMQDS
mmetsp:Transcript_25370/g.58994  ORF Transcript_25370/g.58994 Transcript_25370/m.58994 type:complete len:144 (-) Transcript_25370:1142-1573(-)